MSWCPNGVAIPNWCIRVPYILLGDPRRCHVTFIPLATTQIPNCVFADALCIAISITVSIVSAQTILSNVVCVLLSSRIRSDPLLVDKTGRSPINIAVGASYYYTWYCLAAGITVSRRFLDISLEILAVITLNNWRLFTPTEDGTNR